MRFWGDWTYFYDKLRSFNKLSYHVTVKLVLMIIKQEINKLTKILITIKQL